MSYSSSIVIEELKAGSGASPRSVTLIGPSLPFMGAEWSGTNQIVTTWYPGNSVEATQQNLGPRESPSSWEGMWRRTMMGKFPTPAKDETGADVKIVAPWVLRDFLEDILRGGQRLRVTWVVTGAEKAGVHATKIGNIDSTIVREGRAKSWKFKHDRMQDIGWTIEFEWLGRGGTSAKALSKRTDNARDSVNALDQSVQTALNLMDDKLASLASNVRLSSSKFSLGQLEQLAKMPGALVTSFARQIQQNVSALKQLGEIAKTVADTPFQITNTMVDLARNTMAVANNFVDEMSRIPAEMHSTQHKVGDMARAAKHFGDVTDAAATVSQRAQELREKVLAGQHSQANGRQHGPQATSGAANAAVVAVYMTKQGDTPEGISMKFFKSADHGVDILQANRLPWHTSVLPAGKPLVIPVLSSLKRGA